MPHPEDFLISRTQHPQRLLHLLLKFLAGGGLAGRAAGADEIEAELHRRTFRPRHVLVEIAAVAGLMPPGLNQAIHDDSIKPGISRHPVLFLETMPPEPCLKERIA